MKYLAIALIFFLSSCTPLYLPPIPAKIQVEKITSLNYSDGLGLNDGKLALTLKLYSVSKDGWLSVQWFGPDNLELSSDSKWITIDDEGETLVFLLDEDKPNAGLWRVIVSFDNELLRQFIYEIIEE